MRQRTNINREWRFTLGDHQGAQSPDFDDADWQLIGLPHSFSLPYFQESTFYMGAGWYRRGLVLDEKQVAGTVRLEFEGAFQVADVYVNGVHAGRHEGGYTGFPVDISALARPGVNLLAVRVDNTWDPRVAPLAGEHVFSGGLYRDVWLDTVGLLHVDWYGTRVTTPGLAEGRPVVRVETELRNSGESPVRARLTTTVLDPEGGVVARLESPDDEFAPGVVTVTHTTEVLPDVRLWSPETPVLYRAVSTLTSADGRTLDRYETSFGFRYADWTADRGFFLNGTHRYLLGANVHQDQAGWGDAVTNRSIRRDLELVKEAGFDFVRGSHYPHDPVFASYADELGLLIWSEGVFWGTGPGGTSPWSGGSYPVEERHRAGFEASVRSQLAEMIRINRNSPSVIAWSMGNEAFFCDPEVLPEVRRLLTELVDLSHELDPTRPAAIGGVQRGDLDRIGDIAGYNGDGAWLFPDPGVPNLVSEYGSVIEDRPGSFAPGWGDLAKDCGEGPGEPHPWRYPWRSGEAVWCGFDHGSIAGRAFGSMGIVDYARLPKRSWYWYRDHHRRTPPPAWPVPGRPAGLALTSDRATLESADGTDDVQIVVALVDDRGEPVSCSVPVTLTVESGPGEFATGRRIRFTPDDPAADGLCAVRDGRAAAFFRSYHSGTTRIRATSPGLDDAVIDLVTVGGPPLEGASPVPLDRYAPAAGTAPGAGDGELTRFGRDNPTRASSHRPAHPSRQVNDGCATTHWLPLDGDREPWVAVDLERLVTVRRVHVEFVTDGDHGFVVEASRDRLAWTVIADRSRVLPRDTGSRAWWIDVPGVVALHVRVRQLTDGERACGVRELSVLGRL
ncbi:glycoside hydrolase family 2 TIM barrel-domain containing protein [Streptomyces sp. AS02]|uniref:glycoside hydrolase family 2 protein n=1 Tax=Streptomyces sp. AS02 TaxID=2938946 RepID=UPI0020215E0A|nr:glycoside hydrolase family 2 TIM barrel-domain containing protein [Streptomyces sp. AS02]MCL8017227.1 discoidin domain-containing protein [Streptomyces sp. AS02]